VMVKDNFINERGKGLHLQSCKKPSLTSLGCAALFWTFLDFDLRLIFKSAIALRLCMFKGREDALLGSYSDKGEF